MKAPVHLEIHGLYDATPIVTVVVRCVACNAVLSQSSFDVRVATPADLQSIGEGDALAAIDHVCATPGADSSRRPGPS
jgi:hypothetical protein